MQILDKIAKIAVGKLQLGPSTSGTATLLETCDS
jgi:hypothetical protein